jgi:hypothetical protein
MMVTVSRDSPSCEVTLFDPVSVVYRDVTRQAKGLHHLKYIGALESGLAYLSRCNSGWYYHNPSKFSIHPGSTKMYQDLRRNFWWTRMNREIAKYVS